MLCLPRLSGLLLTKKADFQGLPISVAGLLKEERPQNYGNGLMKVFLYKVTGYINQKPLLELCKVLDAANVNLKAYSDVIYKKLNGGRLQPVLNTFMTLHEQGFHFEEVTRFRELAMQEGIHYVYVGNVPGHEGNNTYCHNCGKLLVERKGYLIPTYNLVGNKCKFCNSISAYGVRV